MRKCVTHGKSNTNDLLTLNPDLVTDDIPSKEEILLKHTWDNNTFISIEDRISDEFVNVKDDVKMSINGGPGAALGRKKKSCKELNDDTYAKN
jgi:hypothetical protein